MKYFNQLVIPSLKVKLGVFNLQMIYDIIGTAQHLSKNLRWRLGFLYCADFEDCSSNFLFENVWNNSAKDRTLSMAINVRSFNELLMY